MNRNYPGVNTCVREKPNPCKAPLCTRPVAVLAEDAAVLDTYGGVTASLKRTIEL